EASARIRDDRVPAETACRGAERVGSVDRAVDEQSRRWPEDIREDPPALELRDLAVAASNQIVGKRIVAVEDEPLGSVVEVREDDRPAFLTCDIGQAAEELRVGLGHPDVDLAPTG